MYRSRMLVGMMVIFALGVLLFTPGAKAGNSAWEMKTAVTFSQPFVVPGHQVLPAGTYVFRKLEGYQEMVQISNADGSRVLALVHTIPSYRAQLGEKTTMSFEEAGVGQPVMLHTWYHPGVRAGHEFPYSFE